MSVLRPAACTYPGRFVGLGGAPAGSHFGRRVPAASRRLKFHAQTPERGTESAPAMSKMQRKPLYRGMPAQYSLQIIS